MIRLAKHFIKELFPQFSLQARVKKLLAANVDPDLCFLEELRQVLSESQGSSRFATFISTQHAAIDVGACGGEYSCIMARDFGKVLSIEPTPDMAAKLRRSLPVNCEVLERAVGESLGSVSLRIPKRGDARMNALSTVARHDFSFSEVVEVDTIQVQQTTIDELVRERNLSPAFIKVDVEGYELEVLLGAVATIQLCNPMFLIEIEKRHNKQFAEIFFLLESHGYAPFHFQDMKLQPSTADLVDASYDYLIGSHISGIEQIISSRASGKYINNFLFLPYR